MTYGERNTAFVLLALNIILFVIFILGVEAYEKPPLFFFLADLASFVLSFGAVGYIAKKRGHKLGWVLLGFLNCIGVVLALCLRDRLRTGAGARVGPSKPASPAGASSWLPGKQTDSLPLPTAENPVCPKCHTVYNRREVIRQLKQQSPYLFDFAVWTTKFRCVKCCEVLTISGTRSE